MKFRVGKYEVELRSPVVVNNRSLQFSAAEHLTRMAALSKEVVAANLPPEPAEGTAGKSIGDVYSQQVANKEITKDSSGDFSVEPKTITNEDGSVTTVEEVSATDTTKPE